MQNNWPEISPAGPERLVAQRYRLGQSLGSGGLGEVFYAEDIKFNPPRRVALKLVHPEYLADAEMLAQIKREAGAMAQLNHPNILQVLDFDINSQEAYIVMQYAAGGSLAQKLQPYKESKPVPFTLTEVDKYLEQICKGLSEAHKQGLIHRDLKPQNILLNEKNQPLLADFSLALDVPTVASESAKKRPRAELVKTEAWGTAEYAAPEVWQGRAGKPSDIYALAALTFELLTGSPPFSGDSESLKRQHNSAPIPKLSKVAPNGEYLSELDKVFIAGLAKRADQRPASPELFYRQFKEAIDKIVQTTTKPGFADVFKNQFIEKRPNSNNKAPTVQATLVSKIVDNLDKIVPAIFLIAMFGWVMSPLLPNLFKNFGVTVLSGTDYNPCISVSGVSWSPDGQKVAGSCFGKMVMVWDTQGKVLDKLEGHSSPVHAVAWSSDSKLLASGSNDNSVQLWVGEEKVPRKLYGHSSGVNAVAWSPDGKLLASGSNDSTIRLWRSDGSFLKFLIEGTSDWIESLAWSPDGTILAAGMRNKAVNLWSVEGKLLSTLVGHDKEVTSVAWSPDGERFASGSDDGTIRIWSKDGKPLNSRLGGNSQVKTIAWSPDGKTLATGYTAGKVELLGKDAQLLREIDIKNTSINGLSWSPDSKKLAVATVNNEVRIISI